MKSIRFNTGAVKSLSRYSVQRGSFSANRNLKPTQVQNRLKPSSFTNGFQNARSYSNSIPAPPRSIKKVGIIGAGQMGTGIAQVAAQVAKLDVVLLDVDKERIVKSIDLIDKLLQKDVVKNRITEQTRLDTKKRIASTTDIKEMENVDIVIEAASEDPDLKLEIFEKLSAITQENCILASNTSSISITKIAAATNRPEKVIGMHFMNPVPIMKLVEIIPGLATDSATLNTTLQLAHSMGKTTTQSKDMPGKKTGRGFYSYNEKGEKIDANK